MNMRRILTGTIVVGIVANALDWLLMKFFWGTAWSSTRLGEPGPADDVVLHRGLRRGLHADVAWDKFGAVSGKGPGAGFKFGLFAGAFVNFPAVLFWQM